ncbi:hypothetical protein R6Z02_05915 [Carnobacterium maltaromaticum]|uniref:hypothetical protein n=1 Tax=Carnobacterium maltaromaticum TaxID=2751 RepID=UPI00191BBF74|nr:hypothetical protein [Carnobacterium maltaromaticum]MDW5523285.1 hypothetical protein [Carnobacterium maltaromaticum]CAD5897658.1 conserved hypothetical protein [Carnobacterium maltaromaticum]
MPFPEELANRVNEYCSSHIPPDSWYEEKFFPFIKDKDIWNRLVIEHKNARFIYKVFEGLQAEDEQLLAQIKTQVIMYVSIQEEVVNYVLFELFKERVEVENLKKINKLTKISIPEKSKELLSGILNHDEQEIIPCYYKDAKTNKTKVRFDQKVPVLVEMDLIDDQLAKDLIRLYEYRNTVHLEAERRKQLDYDLEMGKLAFRRVEGLSIQLSESMKKNKK